MLTQLQLDDEQYEDILEEAINVCGSLYPEWTDYNSHDPGITILELFSLMKESQQYFLDQIGENNRRMYLKLLGYSPMHKHPAECLVRVEAGENVSLLRKMKFLAGDLCFEAKEGRQLLGSEASRFISMHEGTPLAVVGAERMNFADRLGFLPFGEEPEPGDCCYVGFDSPLPTDTELAFYVEVYKDYPIRRNPAADDFSPPVVLKLQSHGADGWKTVANEDETQGLLFDGFCRFTLGEEQAPVEVAGEEGYFFRLVLESGVYDIPPEINSFSMNICRVYQNDTYMEMEEFSAGKPVILDSQISVLGENVCFYRKEGKYYPVGATEKQIDAETGTARICFEEPLPEDADGCLVISRGWDKKPRFDRWQANGFPEQTVELEDLQIAYETLELLVQDVTDKNAYRLWEKVPDFGKSAPGDCHYIFDSAKGILRFGNGVHGMPPEGEVILAGYSRTMGTDGNVKKGKINRFEMEQVDGIEVTNITDAGGGTDEETLDNCFLRARKEMKAPDCAVTAADYERYVMCTPGLMIESCKLLHTKDMRGFYRSVDESGVYLAVKPFGHRRGEKISDCYRRNILGFLENHREIGSNIFILAPEYVDVDIYVDVIVKPQYLKLESRLKEDVGDYFLKYEKKFGAIVSYSGLYGYIEHLEYVQAVRSLNLDVKNGARRSRDGDICLPPNALLVLGYCKCAFTLQG